MNRMLYCVFGYADHDDDKNKERGHLYWFNPRMICTVRSYADEKLANIHMAISYESVWCDLGEWEAIIDKIHTDYCNPKDVRIQEVVVTK